MEKTLKLKWVESQIKRLAKKHNDMEDVQACSLEEVGKINNVLAYTHEYNGELEGFVFDKCHNGFNFKSIGSVIAHFPAKIEEEDRINLKDSLIRVIERKYCAKVEIIS